MSYSEIQEHFLLSFSINQMTNKKGTDLAQQLGSCVRQVLKVWELSEWQVVWGPAVFQNTPDGVYDNAAYIAFNAATSTYFISIAGTNMGSVFDMLEDLGTPTTVDWPFAPGKAQVAIGSFVGLEAVMKMTVPAGMPGAGATITEFLAADLPARGCPCMVLTAGHSLGGALAPLLALWLRDSQDDWDPGGNAADIGCWGFAGPTPGLADFAAYFNERIPNSYRVHNTMDFVPKQWVAQDMEAAKTLYTPPLLRSPLFETIEDVQIAMVKGLDYTQQGAHDTPLQGAYRQIPGTHPNQRFLNYGKQIWYQHVEGYFDLLGLQEQFVQFFKIKP